MNELKVGIAILARAPVAGAAKTRLIPRLGAEGAARLQAWLLRRTVATARQAGFGEISLWCSPDTAHPAFAELAAGAPPLVLRRQVDGDLGERMLRACEDAAGAATLVIGTDCPAFTATHLQHAAACLRAGDDAVVYPASDGGYVLIGVRRAAAELFAGVDWGSNRVMAQTRQCLQQLAWRWSEPATLWDVDDAEDFARLLVLHPELERCNELRN